VIGWLGHDVGIHADLVQVGFSLARCLPGSYAGFASLSDTTISCVRSIYSRGRMARPAGHSGVDLCKIPYANFPESTF
jgi:hypothetical protein